MKDINDNLIQAGHIVEGHWGDPPSPVRAEVLGESYYAPLYVRMYPDQVEVTRLHEFNRYYGPLRIVGEVETE